VGRVHRLRLVAALHQGPAAGRIGQERGSIKMRSLWLAVIIGLGGVFVSIGVLGMSPALAQELEVTRSVSLAPAQPPPSGDFSIIVVFTDPLNIEITDLAGNVLGEGQYEGQVRCNRNGNCSQATQLQLDGIAYEYKFKTRQAVDPVAGRVIVEGTGTIVKDGQRERFLFTATFQDYRDGTVASRYEASMPDASFIVPESRGTFKIYRRQ
jgi:hypothetical protein